LKRLALVPLALILLLLAPAPAEAGRAIVNGYDVLATEGQTVTARVKCERIQWIRWDLRNVDVEFWLWRGDLQSWSRLGTARSGGDGYADFDFQAPTVSGDHFLAGRVAPGQRHRSGWTLFYAGVRPQGSRVVVTDIDSTIYDGSFAQVFFGATGSADPLPGAVQGVRDLAKDATIVYVTARDDYFIAQTRDWLYHWGFPFGRTVFTDDFRSFVIDPTDYKAAVVAELKTRFDVVVGFGDKDTDNAAYLRNGLPSFIFADSASGMSGAAGVYKDWNELRAVVAAGQHATIFNGFPSFR
jgi:hypothetical protein